MEGRREYRTDVEVVLVQCDDEAGHRWRVVDDGEGGRGTSCSGTAMCATKRLLGGRSVAPRNSKQTRQSTFPRPENSQSGLADAHRANVRKGAATDKNEKFFIYSTVLKKISKMPLLRGRL